MSVNGDLLLLLPNRHDVRKKVIHQCSRNSALTHSDLNKQTHLLRYLKGCPDLGPTFSADPTSYPNGVIITAAADSSHAYHTNGRSHSAHLIKIGSHSAPFVTHSSAETSTIALSPCGAEYLALDRCAQNVIYFRVNLQLTWAFHKPNPQSTWKTTNQPLILQSHLKLLENQDA